MLADLPVSARYALRNTSEAMGCTKSPERAFEALSTRAMSALGTEACSVILHDSKRGKLTFTASAGLGAEALVGEEFDAELGIAGRVLRTGKVDLVNNARRDQEFYSGIDRKTGVRTDSVICIPICQGDTTVGVLESLNKAHGAPFIEWEVRLLQLFGNLVTSSNVNAALNARQTSHRISCVGDRWYLRFADADRFESCQLSTQHPRELLYLQQLLTQPYASFSATALQLTADRMENRNDRAPVPDSPHTVQQLTLRAACRRLNATRLHLEESERGGDAHEAPLLRMEQNHLLRYVRISLGAEGKLIPADPTVPALPLVMR